ncbi:hypothetical protein [Anaerofustis stercorihominis]|uniref:DUF1492 domain-containing protein n=1 Tax=Anaerofustis stercorihominis TaxID=214853 RepID=A0A3E3DXL7_9FIRM|nr:hypothetical protein [Anaerofustis stercorihominis]RGD73826.1 hypothetical protein DW687_08600 [Anaerofustis stercorihominis]
MTKDEFYKISNKLRDENLKLYRINRRLAQIEKQQGIKAGIGSEIQSNNNNNLQECLSDEKIDLEKDKQELEIVISYNEKELNRYISKVDNEVYRDLLYYKYIKNLKWYDIADIIGYTIDHTKGYVFRRAKKELFKTF